MYGWRTKIAKFGHFWAARIRKILIFVQNPSYIAFFTIKSIIYKLYTIWNLFLTKILTLSFWQLYSMNTTNEKDDNKKSHNETILIEKDF